MSYNYIDAAARRCRQDLELTGVELTAEAVEAWCGSNPRPNRRPMRWPEIEEVKEALGLAPTSVKVEVKSIDSDWNEADVVVLEDGRHWWRGNRATLTEVDGLAVGAVIEAKEYRLEAI